MIYRVEIEVIAPIEPTEDPEEVRSAILEVFPSAEITSQDGRLAATAHSIDRFTELLSKQRILDTARARLKESRTGDSLGFRLKKQAAHAGVVNFALDEPDELGDLIVRIHIEQPSPEEFIEEITAPP